MYLNQEGIDKLVKEYEDSTKAIKEELLRMCWYMRGGLSYSEAHLLTVEERQLIAQIVEENLKSTKESGLPFF